MGRLHRRTRAYLHEHDERDARLLVPVRARGLGCSTAQCRVVRVPCLQRIAQTNQMRRAINFKLEKERKMRSRRWAPRRGFRSRDGCSHCGGPALQSAIVGANMGPVSAMAAAPAGPFTVHFGLQCPSGSSQVHRSRPQPPRRECVFDAVHGIDRNGVFFSRYAMLVTPINYLLCSVNLALFGSSAWHLGRKIKADYIDGEATEKQSKSRP